MSDVFCFLVQWFTKTKLKKSSFPLKVRFKNALNQTYILSGPQRDKMSLQTKNNYQRNKIDSIEKCLLSSIVFI